jgi:hypothetical protein
MIHPFDEEKTPDFNEQQHHDRRFGNGAEVNESKLVKNMKHLKFDSISSIQFCIDGAVGLPVSTTATRVSARLLSFDRTQVGEPSAPSFSDPDSEATSPRFELHMGWRGIDSSVIICCLLNLLLFIFLICFFLSIGSALQPSLTIVCRIDTLEKPSLLPRCVGFAVIKLCLNEEGKQPSPDAGLHDKVYLNAGQFLLPIVYGIVPEEGNFSEELMDTLPHIHDAYLLVRLFDPTVDIPPPVTEHEEMSLFRIQNLGNQIHDSSVVGVLIRAMPYRDESQRKLPLSEHIIEEVRAGLAIGEGEKRVVMRQCIEWIASVFPLLKHKIPLIDPRFMLSYEDQFGVFCALDMLHNMPVRKDLLSIAKQALGPIGYFQPKKYDNHIRYYKSYFRYLPGFIPEPGKTKHKKPESVADMIIDDASLDINLDSYEYNPVFHDDFSRTVGIDLSPHACLLIVVTAVDILTSQQLAMTATHLPPTTKKSVPISRDVMGSNYKISTTQSTQSRPRNGEEDKAFKLRGLQGVYFGNNDPQSSWWGIVPLILDSPFEYHRGNEYPRKENSGSKSVKKTSPLKGDSNSPNKLRSNDSENSPDSTLKGRQFFINAGTHMVPLFEGFPPVDLFRVSSPLAWLLSNLLSATKKSNQLIQSHSSFSWNCTRFNQSTTIDAIKYKPQTEGGILQPICVSSGASAIISIIDPRLRQFSNDSVFKDPNIVIKEDLLLKVIRAKFAEPGYKNPERVCLDPNIIKHCEQLHKMFRFKSGHKLNLRTYNQSLPPSVYVDTFIVDVNNNFIRIITEDDETN